MPTFCELLLVTPTRGVWIEMAKAAINAQIKDVTPTRGVWIEIKYLEL